MGELTYNNRIVTTGRMMEVAMVMKKVEIRISMEQLASLGRIMSSYLANILLIDIDSKAIFYLLWAIYEGKVRKKMLSMKPGIKLSLDMAQAWAMMAMLQELDLSVWPYEHQVCQYIISEIHHQTV
jgi:hypothetical protein